MRTGSWATRFQSICDAEGQKETLGRDIVRLLDERLTSLRFFCFRMAKRKRAMALSALGVILVEVTSVVLIWWFRLV